MAIVELSGGGAGALLTEKLRRALAVHPSPKLTYNILRTSSAPRRLRNPRHVCRITQALPRLPQPLHIMKLAVAAVVLLVCLGVSAGGACGGARFDPATEHAPKWGCRRPVCRTPPPLLPRPTPRAAATNTEVIPSKATSRALLVATGQQPVRGLAGCRGARAMRFHPRSRQSARLAPRCPCFLRHLATPPAPCNPAPWPPDLTFL